MKLGKFNKKRLRCPVGQCMDMKVYWIKLHHKRTEVLLITNIIYHHIINFNRKSDIYGKEEI